MSKDQTTLINSVSKEFGDRMTKLALQCPDITVVQAAMSHTEFEKRHHAFINQLARAYDVSKPLLERAAIFTVRLGQWSSKDQMVAAVREAGYSIYPYVMSVIFNDKFVLLTEVSDYEFFVATVAEVTGHDNTVTTAELYKAMQALGFIIAPHESALTIRIAYSDQEMDDYQVILSEQAADSDGDLSVLGVHRDSDGLGVRSYYANPVDEWSPVRRLLLCRKVETVRSKF